MIYDLVDSVGGPVAEGFTDFGEAVARLREVVGSDLELAYEVAILAFNEAGERSGGPITLDPFDLLGPPVRHAHCAPAPPEDDKVPWVWESFPRFRFALGPITILGGLATHGGIASVAGPLNEYVATDRPSRPRPAKRMTCSV